MSCIKRSGTVRYVRISCSVVAGSKPAMMDLMANINTVSHVSSLLVLDSFPTFFLFSLHFQIMLQELHAQPHSGEIFLLKLMIGFYEECDGWHDTNVVPITEGQPDKKGPIHVLFLSPVFDMFLYSSLIS